MPEICSVNTTKNHNNPLLLACAALLCGALLVIGLFIFAEDDHYQLEIALADIPEDQILYKDWHGQWLLIVRPRAELADDQADLSIRKAKEVVDPPARTARDAYPVKVYLLDRNQSYLMFGFNKWYNTIVPCASFHYIDQPFRHEDKIVRGGFKCTQSLDDFWQDKLVFNLFGRAQSKEVPDLYSPWYRIVDDKLIVGMK
ncbi:hypothetical protein M5M_11885 [Simiduia agarivorans SA1 = DSM 21679]|uniref:Uncharacterized protein n=1 Tax=Simiduia agarivorans (strain DSM 21679 / JCM 13881 / BCRC 17597 / SA1) TaxID=1117647 RepID=K4KK74_SIMAS|nr:hypothetical protein M5M_11885 [Simiduia agarivorans SA1 = DSM 21679]